LLNRSFLVILGWHFSQKAVGRWIKAIGELRAVRHEQASRGAALPPRPSPVGLTPGGWAARAARLAMCEPSLLCASPGGAAAMAQASAIAAHYFLCTNIAPVVLAMSHNALLRFSTCAVHASISYAPIWFWSFVNLLQNNRFELALDARRHGLWIPRPCADTASPPPPSAWRADLRYSRGEAVVVDVAVAPEGATVPVVVYLHSNDSSARYPPSSEDPMLRLVARRGLFSDLVISARRFMYYVLAQDGSRGQGGRRVAADMFNASAPRVLLHLGAALVTLAMASPGFLRLEVCFDYSFRCIHSFSVISVCNMTGSRGYFGHSIL
jgi:hypothetical protein